MFKIVPGNISIGYYYFLIKIRLTKSDKYREFIWKLLMLENGNVK